MKVAASLDAAQAAGPAPSLSHPRATGAARRRLVLPDTLKWLAAHVIVWHHLALYGPLAQAWAELTPQLHDALATYGRQAVPVFLVLGGYLTLRSLQARWRTQPLTWATLPLWWWQRYVRLVAPYAVALALAVLANAWGQGWLDAHAVGQGHSVWEVLAHLSLLHSLLGVESISAGVWYVAIDWQLFVLLSVLLTAVAQATGAGKLPQFKPHALPAALWLVVAVSVLGVNRHTAWDAWALYFFGAYGAGALLAAVQAHDNAQRLGWWTALLALLMLRLSWDPSPQVWTLWATVLALMLATAWRDAAPHAHAVGATPMVTAARSMAAYASLGARESYALFLVHFAVLIAVNTAWARWAPDAWLGHNTVHAQAVAAALLAAWMLSLLAARALHRAVEEPVARWLDRPHNQPEPFTQAWAKKP